MAGKCQLCGKERQLTQEHVPPQSFYPKEIRQHVGHLNSVDACAPCNNGSSVSDEMAKVVVGLIASSPWTTQIREGVARTLDKNKRLDRLVQDNKRFEKIWLSDGTEKDAIIYSLPPEHNEAFFGVIEKTVKGLYYQNYQKVLDEHYEISMFQPDVIHHTLQEEITEKMRDAEVKTVNADSIEYVFFDSQSSDIVCVIRLFNSFKLFFVLKELGWRDKNV